MELYPVLESVTSPAAAGQGKKKERAYEAFRELFSEMRKLRAPKGFKYRAPEEEAISAEELEALGV